MKFSKIILGSAILAMAMGFVSCSDDDDPNGMISGSNNHYSIEYTNESATDISRGISNTAFKHAGATVKIEFDHSKSVYAGGKDKNKAGIMGLIFDLEEVDGKKSFDVVGLRAVKDSADLEFYVSRFENVVDLQADNFGAKNNAQEGAPKETVYKAAFQNATGKYENDITSVIVYVTQEKATEAGKDTNNVSYNTDEYIYKVYLLNNVTAKDFDSEGNIEASKLGDAKPVATIATGYTGVTQKKLAVYANVYTNSTLAGNWTYLADYKQVSLED